MKKTALLLLIIPSLVYASGQMSVMDPITKLGKYLKGGTGIDINAANGTITATGVAVPVGTVTEAAFAVYTSSVNSRLASGSGTGNLDGGNATSTYLTQINGGGAY